MATTKIRDEVNPNSPMGCCDGFVTYEVEGTPEASYCAFCYCHQNLHQKIRMPPLPPQLLPPLVIRDMADQKLSTSKSKKTVFTEEQRAKMSEFAGHLGWQTKAEDAEAIKEFCGRIMVAPMVFKSWIRKYRCKDPETGKFMAKKAKK